MAAMAVGAACHVKWINCIWVVMSLIIYVGAGCMIQGIIWLSWPCYLSITSDHLLLLPTLHTLACACTAALGRRPACSWR